MVDFVLVLILSVFIGLLGGLFVYSQRSSAARAGLPLELSLSPEELVDLQMDAVLEGKGMTVPEGGAWTFKMTEKENYEAQKSGAPSAAAADGKPLQSTLLKRCIECLQATMRFDAQQGILFEAYNNLIPREVMGRLQQIKTELTDEIAEIKSEASALRPGWGEGIFQQAMDLTVGLQQRKAARAQAEEAQRNEVKNAGQSKITDARAEEEKKLRLQREADKAYQALMAEGAKKDTTPNKRPTAK